MHGELLLLLTLIFFSSFFSSAETALMSVTSAQVKDCLNKEKRGAKTLYQIKKDPQKLIVTILIGNNIVNIFAASLATVIFTDIYGSKGIGIATGVMTFVVLIFGEIIPKSFAAKYAITYSLFIAKITRLIMIILTPLIWVFSGMTTHILKLLGADGNLVTVTEDEVKAMVSIGAEEGAIESYEKTFIENVLDFGDTIVEEVMIPRVKIKSLNIKLGIKQVSKKILDCHYSRYPVFQGKLDNIKGILHISDVLKALSNKKDPKTLADLPLYEALQVPSSMRIHDLFLLFQKNHSHMAIVYNALGGVIGLVTMEDVLEEIVGEIIDETDDDKEEWKQINKNTILVKGELEIEKINEVLGINIPEGEIRIASYIVAQIHRFPEEGDRFEFNGVKMKIEKMKNNIIKTIRIEKTKTAI